MSMLDDTTKANLMQAFEMKRNRDVIKILKQLVKKPSSELMGPLTDVFAQMLAMDPMFFNEVMYLDIQKVLLKVAPVDLFTMDRTLIERFCLVQGEQIIGESYASVEENFGRIKPGRVFITPYRIIASGFKKIQTKGLGAAVGAFAAIQIAMDMSRKIKDAIMRQFQSQDRIMYGFVYPVKNSIRFKRSASVIKYRNEMEYEDKKGKMKTIKLDLKIQPLPMKGQDKTEFKENTAKAFDAIATIIGPGV